MNKQAYTILARNARIMSKIGISLPEYLSDSQILLVRLGTHFERDAAVRIWNDITRVVPERGAALRAIGQAAQDRHGRKMRRSAVRMYIRTATNFPR